MEMNFVKQVPISIIKEKQRKGTEAHWQNSYFNDTNTSIQLLPFITNKKREVTARSRRLQPKLKKRKKL